MPPLTKEFIQDWLTDHDWGPADQITFVSSGRNSQSANVRFSDSGDLFFKSYAESKNGDRNRLSNEVESLKLLWDSGFRQIPQVLFEDKAKGITIFNSIEGTHLDAEKITKSDIDQAIEFYSSIQACKSKAKSIGIHDAAEARYSIDDHLDLMQKRFDRVSSISHSLLQTWIQNEFKESFSELKQKTIENCQAHGLDLSLKLSLEKRILSPSDVGFHNILKDPSGKLFFIDFEYFGWDDPVKTISDFVLQSEIPVPTNLRPHAIQRFKEVFLFDEEDDLRFKVLLPIFAFKWCFILMNLFLSDVKSDEDKLKVQAEKVLSFFKEIKRDFLCH